MGDMGDLFNDWRESKKTARGKRLEDTKTMDMSGWIQHTEYHWSRDLQGQKLNWWPSTGKWSWGTRNNKSVLYYGTQNDLLNFIAKRSDSK